MPVHSLRISVGRQPAPMSEGHGAAEELVGVRRGVARVLPSGSLGSHRGAVGESTEGRAVK
eukprot:15285698-Alexandrium_andersonii.AAC.1